MKRQLHLIRSSIRFTLAPDLRERRESLAPLRTPKAAMWRGHTLLIDGPKDSMRTRPVHRLGALGSLVPAFLQPSWAVLN